VLIVIHVEVTVPINPDVKPGSGITTLDSQVITHACFNVVNLISKVVVPLVGNSVTFDEWNVDIGEVPVNDSISEATPGGIEAV
jgi:hypothetical protein